MSKAQKRINKFISKPPPKDFRWEEFVVLMDDLGFDFEFSGGGSSHGHFTLREDPEKTISSYRPHPSGTLFVAQIKEVVSRLKEWGVLDE